MVGDVKSAFRHLRVAACDANWLGARVPGSSHWGLDLRVRLVGAAARLSTSCLVERSLFLVSRESPNSLNPTLSNDTEPFWALEWMDDHILIELVTQPASETVPARARAAETALRLGMMSGTEALGTAFFSINVREHLSLCLAVSIWAQAWSTLGKGTLHVHAWIDNASSVSWANKLAASNVYAQELNRHLALAQAVNRLYVTAGHMAGARNEMADCGSRSLVELFKSRWLQLSHGWEASPVPADLRYMYKPTSDVFKTPLWPQAHTNATRPRGSSGASGESITDSHHGSPRRNASRPTNSSSTSCTSATAATPLPPSDPNYAASLGVISDTVGTLWRWHPTIGSSSEGWNGTTEPPDEWSPSQRQCSGICVPDSTSTTPSSAHSGGLRSWASSFSCGSPSTSTKGPSPRSTVSA